MSPLVLVYAAGLVRLSRQGRHDPCDDQQCLAVQIDDASYRTAHATPDCTCSQMDLGVQTMLAIVRNGRTPLVQSAMNQDGSMTASYVFDDAAGGETFAYLCLKYLSGGAPQKKLF